MSIFKHGVTPSSKLAEKRLLNQAYGKLGDFSEREAWLEGCAAYANTRDREPAYNPYITARWFKAWSAGFAFAEAGAAYYRKLRGDVK